MEFRNSDLAPKAIGPYSHAVRSGNFVICSGQIPVDPSTGKLNGTEINSQTEQVFKNISAVLSSFDLNLNAVVKTTVYLKSMDDFAAMNAVYAKAFGDHKPVRTTIAVKDLPLGALVEIECFAEIA